MPAVSYSRISTFLDTWENTIENIEVVLFVPSLDNLVKLALTQLESKKTSNPPRNSTGYRWDLLRSIDADLKRKLIIVNVMRLECDNEFTDLQTELAKPTFDVAAIYPLLQSISLSPSKDLLRRELNKILVSVRRLDHDRLSALIQLLLRQAATRFSASDLKNLPRRILAQQYIQTLVEGIVEEIYGRRSIQEECTRVLHEVFLSCITDSDVMRPHQAHGRDQALWYLTSDIPDILRVHIDQVLAANPHLADPVETLLSDETSLRVIGLQMLECYLRTLLTVLFRSVGWRENQSRESRFEGLSRLVGDVVIQKGNLRNQKHPNTSVRPVIQDQIAESALAKPFADLLATRALSSYNPEDWEDTAKDLARLVLTSIHRYLVQQGTTWDGTSADQISMSLITGAAQRNLHLAITDLLKPFHEYSTVQIGQLPAGFAGGITADETQRFWETWSQSFEDFARSSHTILDFLPWDQLSVKEFRKGMEALFLELFRTERRSLVILRINDIKPEDQVWSTGNMTFYDPAVINYGEDRGNSGPTLRAEDTQYVIGLAVSVDAFSDYDAQQKALQNAKDALHVISFAFSVNQRHGGFRPQMIRGFATYQIEPKHWSWQWHSERAEQHDVLLAKTQNAVGIAQEYNRLILLATDTTTQPNALQQGFLDSLHWYIRGRWNSDAVERFLFHWIGLEHLFVGGKPTKEELFDLLPRLYTTWGDVAGIVDFIRSLRQIRSTLERSNLLSSLADRSAVLKGWRTDYRVFMKPRKLPALRGVFSVADADERSRLDAYITELLGLLRQRRKVIRAIEHNREAAAVALRLLYDWRNEMAHEGAPYRLGMEYYANKMESILENILRKMADEVLRIGGICKSTDDLITLYKGPFV